MARERCGEGAAGAVVVPGVDPLPRQRVGVGAVVQEVDGVAQLIGQIDDGRVEQYEPRGHAAQ